MKSKFAALFTLVLASTLLAPVAPAHAVSVNYNHLIDNGIFDNSSAMSASQVDSFLNGFQNSCISSNSTFRAPDPTGYSPTNGYIYGSNVTAGRVIYDAANAYQLNPQVLLTTLQKEQSLVTGSAGCGTLAYSAAMGYGCPDAITAHSYTGVNLYTKDGKTVTSVSGTCVTSKLDVGFSQQVIHAAWLLKFDRMRSEGNVTWAIIKGSWDNSDDPSTCYNGYMTEGTFQRCPSGSSAPYDGYATIDSSSVHMDDGATAALYDYTPHLSGNNHFVTIFSTWFGTPTIDVFPWEVVEESGGDGKYYLVVGNTKRWIPTSQLYQDWDLNTVPVQTVSSSYFNSIPTLPNLGRIGVLKTGQYVFVDNGHKWLLGDSNHTADWGVSQADLVAASPLYSLLSNMPTYGTVNQYVKDASTGNEYLMSGGVLLPINSSYLSRWNIGSPTTLTSTATADFTTGASIGYEITFSGRDFIADSGRLLEITPSTGSAYQGIASTFASVTPYLGSLFAISTAGKVVEPSNSNQWYFLLGGTAHYIPSTDILRDWGQPAKPQSISGALFAEFTTSSVNLSPLIQDTANSQYYYLDGNSMHNVPSSMLNTWVSNDNAMQVNSSDLTQSNGAAFNSPLFQVIGTPNLYTMVNGQYYHIPSQSVLQSLGYPNTYSLVELSPAIFSYLQFAGTAHEYMLNSGTTYYLQGGKAYPISSSAVGAWTDGSNVLNYLGNDFAQRYSVQSTSLTALVNDTSDKKWVISNGSALDISKYADAYSFASFSPLDSSSLSKAGAASFLAKSPSDGKLWLITNGSKQWLTSWTEYSSFGGGMIPLTILNDSLLNSIPDETPSNGPSIIIQTGSSGLKLLVSGKYYSFPDSSTLTNTVTGNPITNVSSSIFYTLNKQAGIMSRLIRDTSNGKIYYLESGKKCWITSNQAYQNYKSLRLINLPDSIINWFPNGSPIS